MWMIAPRAKASMNTSMVFHDVEIADSLVDKVATIRMLSRSINPVNGLAKGYISLTHLGAQLAIIGCTLAERVRVCVSVAYLVLDGGARTPHYGRNEKAPLEEGPFHFSG